MKKVVWFVLVFTLFGCSGNGEKFDGVFEGRPRVNPPYVVGNYPGTEFIFAIPTSGERPMTWTVEGLPEGLKLKRMTGDLSLKQAATELQGLSMKMSTETEVF